MNSHLSLQQHLSKLSSCYYAGDLPEILIGMSDENFRNRILLFNDTYMIIGDHHGILSKRKVHPNYYRHLRRLFDKSNECYYDYAELLDSLYNRYWIEKFNCSKDHQDLYNTLFNFMVFCNKGHYSKVYCIYYWQSFFEYINYIINNMYSDNLLINKSTKEKLNSFLSTTNRILADDKTVNDFHYSRHEADILLNEYYFSVEVNNLFLK